jgi:hypothetical protein
MRYHLKVYDNIQIITFDKVDTMVYQPRRSDNYRGQRPR